MINNRIDNSLKNSDMIIIMYEISCGQKVICVSQGVLRSTMDDTLLQMSELVSENDTSMCDCVFHIILHVTY